MIKPKNGNTTPQMKKTNDTAKIKVNNFLKANNNDLKN